MPKNIKDEDKEDLKKVDDEKSKKPKGKKTEVETEPEMDTTSIHEAPLSIAQRRKKAISIKKNRFKLKRGRKKAARRMATGDKLKSRSRRAAIKQIRSRFAGKKGQNYSKLSYAQKASVDRIVQRKKGSISRLAKRAMPGVRKAERTRYKSRLRREFWNNKFEAYLAEIQDSTPKKRYHSLFGVDKKPFIDGRFKIYKKKKNIEKDMDIIDEAMALLNKDK